MAAVGLHQGLALQVCQNCKARKKACDKRLPSCGACLRRQVRCSYEPLGPQEPSASAVGATNSGGTGIDPDVFHRLIPNLRASVLLMDAVSDSFPSSLITLTQVDYHRSIYNQVCRLINMTRLDVDDVVLRFFSGPHSWLPVASKQRFHEHVVQFLSAPNATFSVLLLAMCLIVYRPEPPSSHCMDQESLYLTTKMMFDQVHTVIPASQNLIQAGVLLAGFEYVQGRATVALATISSCARMGYTLNIHRSVSQSIPDDPVSRDRLQERKVLWWIIVIFERLITLEVPSKTQPLLTRFPGKRTDSQMSRRNQEESHDLPVLDSDIQLSLPTELAVVGQYSRGVQMAMFLDDLLTALCLEDPFEMVHALERLDRDAQAFLTIIMQGPGCVPIATTVRILFELHNTLCAVSSTGSERLQASRAALDSMTKLFVDVAKVYVKNFPESHIDNKPPADPYNLVAAIKHLEAHQCNSPSLDADREVLSQMLARFNRRWGSPILG